MFEGGPKGPPFSREPQVLRLSVPPKLKPKTIDLKLRTLELIAGAAKLKPETTAQDEDLRA